MLIRMHLPLCPPILLALGLYDLQLFLGKRGQPAMELNIAMEPL